MLSIAAPLAVLMTEAHVSQTFGPKVYLGMLSPCAVSIIIGWLLGGSDIETRRTMLLMTTTRNVAAGFSVVSNNLAGTEALAAAIAYAVVSGAGAFLAALVMRKCKILFSRLFKQSGHRK